MDKVYLLLIILGHFMFLSFCHVFTIRRLRYLNKKYVEYTRIDGLIVLYKQLIKIIFILLLILFVVSGLIIVIFLQ